MIAISDDASLVIAPASLWNQDLFSEVSLVVGSVPGSWSPGGGRTRPHTEPQVDTSDPNEVNQIGSRKL